MQRGLEHNGAVAAHPVGASELLAEICTDSVGTFTRLFREYGNFVAFPKGTSDLTVFAFGPEANHTVLTHPEIYHACGPPGSRNSSQRKFQQGLFGLSGPQHLKHRRLLMPALSKRTVVDQAGAMTEIIDRFLDGWRPGRQIDLYAEMKNLSLAIAGKLLFGLDEIPDKPEIAATFQKWIDGFYSTFCEMTLPIEAPAGSYEQMIENAEKLEGHFRQLIRIREPVLRADDGDLMALLLHAHQAGHISETEVIGEMQSLMIASYQTTASALTWTLLMLAQHPQVLAELHGQLDADVDPASAEASLLDRVIKESMRVLPPVVFPFKQVAEPTVLLGRRLPALAFTFVSYYVTHHMSDLFPEPERFRPDRWLGQTASPYAYLPFSAGPRMCMGTAFSLQMFQIAISKVVRRYRLAIAPGTRVDRRSSVTLGIQGTLPVTILRQDGRFSAVPLTGNIHEMVNLPRHEAERIAA